MRYHFKQLGIFEDFICYQKLSGKDFEDGLVIIDSDMIPLKSMDYLDHNQNVEHYIEHLAPGTGLKEMLSDYCKSDILSKVQNMPEGHENKGQKTSSSTMLVSIGEKTHNLVLNAEGKKVMKKRGRRHR